MKRTFATATAIVALTAGAAFAQEAPDQSAMINANDAAIEGNSITGVSVEIERPGYLVIHNEGEGAPPASLGHIKVDAGMSDNITVEADGPLDPESGLSLMLHYETNDNDTYDFGPGSTDVDTPVSVGDAVVSVPVMMSGDAMEEDAMEEDGAMEEAPMEEEGAMEEGGAMEEDSPGRGDGEAGGDASGG